MRLIALLLWLSTTACASAEPNVETISQGHGVIWGLTQLDANTLMFSQRHGEIGLLDLKTGKTLSVAGAPEVAQRGQGGLLDVQAEPGYKSGGWIYFTYSKAGPDGAFTTLARARLQQQQLIDWQDLLETRSASNAGQHFGSRIAFDHQGHVFFSVGDRGHRPNAQNLMNHAGSILRLNLDGSVPHDNPFVGRDDALPEIWSYGHRNPQGLSFDAQTGRLWEIEHGPRGGDEINLIEQGRNYGWPVISYGKEYWGPKAVGEGTHRKGMEQPVKYYVPSIAPGSLLLYRGQAFPAWQGSLLAGALKLQHLNRISLNSQAEAIDEQRLLQDQGERLRSLLLSTNGELYIGTDSGKILHISP